MSMVRVVVPFLQGKRRFRLTKGRTWSIVEHLILVSAVNESTTATNLADLSKLPYQVVIEALLRLMHAGWVQISQTRDAIVFHPTERGREVAARDELPSIQKPFNRSMNLMIDQITGTVYRRREMQLFEKHVLQSRGERDRLVWLEPRDLNDGDQVKAIVGTLFDEDERFVSMDDTGERLVERFGVAAVRDGIIEGFSSRAPESLQKIIRQAAEAAETSPSVLRFAAPAEPDDDEAEVQPKLISFSNDDLILGGQEHEECLKRTIQRCRNTLIIHSTFLLQDKFDSIKPILMNAVQRGVNIHILWGKTEDPKEQSATKIAAAKIQEELSQTSLGDAIKVHQFSTNSHAKIIVADEGTTGRHFAVVGSCNWLYSGFQSFEASVRLRDPHLCAEVVDQLAELSRADGHWTPLTNYFARLAFDIRRETVAATGRAEGMLVLGHQHAQFMRMARDTAIKRIVVTSHRIGPAGRPAVIIPAISAAEARELDVKLFFGMPSERGDGARAADMTMEARASNVRIEPIFQPKVHAKVLAWDNDFVLISSQNWLSADPSENYPRKEIGVFLRAPGVARRLIDKFMFECNAS
jgi:cardiolipin synthase